MKRPAVPLSEVELCPCPQQGICTTRFATRKHLVVYFNYDHYGRSLTVLPFRQPLGARRLSVLSELNVGESGVLVALDLPESVQNHLMHMGFVPDARVTVLRRAPAGDPTVYGVDGMEIALRHETAEAMRVRAALAEDSEDEEIPIEAAR